MKNIQTSASVFLNTAVKVLSHTMDQIQNVKITVKIIKHYIMNTWQKFLQNVHISGQATYGICSTSAVQLVMKVAFADVITKVLLLWIVRQRKTATTSTKHTGMQNQWFTSLENAMHNVLVKQLKSKFTLTKNQLLFT